MNPDDRSHQAIYMYVCFFLARVKRCNSDKDCKSGRNCVTPYAKFGSKEKSPAKECIHTPFQCKKDSDCEKGRVCIEDKEFREIKKVCKSNGLGTKCKKDGDCPRDGVCKHGMCKQKKRKVNSTLK